MGGIDWRMRSAPALDPALDPAPAPAVSLGLALCLVLGLGSAGCAPQPAPAVGVAPPPGPAPTRPLCRLETKLASDLAPRDRTYPPGYWLTLLVDGYRASGEIPRPACDCLGERIQPAWDGCPSDRDPDPDPLPPRALTPSDVVVTSLGPDRRLVWAMIDHLADGEAQGPVAIAELVPKGIVVQVLGVLRAYPQNVSVRLERVGPGSVLVADGEFCDAGQIGEECVRAVRLLPVVGNRFVSGPMVDNAGACLGRAFIPVRGAGTATRGDRYRVETLVTVRADAVLLREQLAIEAEPQHPSSARDSYVTRVQADRQVSLRGGQLVASGPSLLSRWMAPRGSQGSLAKP